MKLDSHFPGSVNFQNAGRPVIVIRDFTIGGVLRDQDAVLISKFDGFLKKLFGRKR